MICYVQAVLWYGLLALLSLVAMGYAYCSWSYGYFRRRGYPYEPPYFPLGNLLPVFTLRKSYSSFLADLYNKYKGEEFVGFFQFGKKSVLILDRDLVKNVLAKDFDHFDQKSVYYDKDREPLTAHLFAIAGEEWRTLRRKMVPAYSSGKLKEMFGTVTDVGRELNKYVAKISLKSDVIECKDLFTRYGLRMIASTAFGLDTDVFNDSSSTFVENANSIVPPTLNGMLRTSLKFFGADIAKALKIRVMPKECHDFFLNLVIDTMNHREATGKSRNDFMQLMIQLRNEANGEAGLTLNEISAQSFVFFLAGLETVSNTMGFFLYELAINTEIQQKVLDDVDSVDDITYQSLASMEYLEMAIDETLRKHPSLAFLSRECSRDYLTHGGRLIEKGTQVLVSLRGLHYDPEYFPDPHVFDPERFSRERKQNVKPYTFMPFGEGPRMCIGMRFGRLVVKAGLATLLREFRVEQCERTPYPLRYQAKSITTTAEGGLWLRVVPRNAC